jgi:hypothetical protein
MHLIDRSTTFYRLTRELEKSGVISGSSLAATSRMGDTFPFASFPFSVRIIPKNSAIPYREIPDSTRC